MQSCAMFVKVLHDWRVGLQCCGHACAPAHLPGCVPHGRNARTAYARFPSLLSCFLRFDFYPAAYRNTRLLAICIPLHVPRGHPPVGPCTGEALHGASGSRRHALPYLKNAKKKLKPCFGRKVEFVLAALIAAARTRPWHKRTHVRPVGQNTLQSRISISFQIQSWIQSWIFISVGGRPFLLRVGRGLQHQRCLCVYASSNVEHRLLEATCAFRVCSGEYVL